MAEKRRGNKPTDLETFLEEQNLTEPELKALLLSARAHKPGEPKTLSLTDKHVKYGYFSDAHIGHKEFKEEIWTLMQRHFKKEGVEFIVDSGDHLEGMFGRPGHIYELTHIGFTQQMAYATELYSSLPSHIYGIDGNHDETFTKRSDVGVIVGEELQRRVQKYEHIGVGEGTIILNPHTRIMLFHPNDGSSYAISYKLQKLIESFTGGEKPNIVHEGHYHKALYMFSRNIHGFESGTLSGQSRWMRGKKIPAHMGYGIVDVYLDRKGVNRLVHTFVPYYET